MRTQVTAGRLGAKDFGGETRAQITMGRGVGVSLVSRDDMAVKQAQRRAASSNPAFSIFPDPTQQVPGGGHPRDMLPQAAGEEAAIVAAFDGAAVIAIADAEEVVKHPGELREVVTFKLWPSEDGPHMMATSTADVESVLEAWAPPEGWTDPDGNGPCRLADADPMWFNRLHRRVAFHRVVVEQGRLVAAARYPPEPNMGMPVM